MAETARIGEGNAFVTEYAGPSNVIQQFGIWDAAWDAKPFTDLAAVSVIDTLTSQGLIEKMYHSIIIDGTDPETAAKDCEKKLNEAFKAAGASIK